MKKFISGLLLTVFIVVLWISSISLLILVPLKTTVNKGMVKNWIQNVDVATEIKKDTDLGQAVDDFLEPVYEKTREYGIDDQIILDIINSQEMKDLIGDVAANIIDYVLTGKNQKLISITDIEKLISDAIDDINNSGLYTINNDTKEQILNVIRDRVSEYQDLIPETKVFDEAIAKELTPKEMQLLNIVRYVLSFKFLIGLLIAFIVSTLGIISLKTSKVKWLKWWSIPLLVASIITMLVTVLLDVVRKQMENITVLNSIIRNSYILSGSIIVLMIIALIISAVLKRKLKGDENDDQTKALKEW